MKNIATIESQIGRAFKALISILPVLFFSLLLVSTAWGAFEGGAPNFNSFFGTGAGNPTTTGSADTFMGGNAGHLNTTGSFNTFMGHFAGSSNTTGNYNTFMGPAAGYFNTTGYANTFMGYSTGYFNTTGSFNTFMGHFAGSSNTTGFQNTFMGVAAGGSNTTGNGNVFLGYYSGYSETGSNKLYIDNCYIVPGLCTLPLIYGEFDKRSVRINGAGIGVTGYPSYTLDVSNHNVNKSALHFSLNGTDTGGWITSVADNNFWLSSGAMWDKSAGGWVQKSPDGRSVMAGVAGTLGYRVMTRSGCALGTVCAPTPRLTIDYSGNVGIGIVPIHLLHLAGGAYSDGLNWYPASSREYKDNIQALSAESAIQTLNNLNPVTFTYKSMPDQGHVGFIAEDVPDLVALNGRKAIDPVNIIGILTKVVQEKSQVIEKQQKTLETLEAKLAKLESEMQRLKSMNVTAKTVEQ